MNCKLLIIIRFITAQSLQSVKIIRNQIFVYNKEGWFEVAPEKSAWKDIGGRLLPSSGTM